MAHFALVDALVNDPAAVDAAVRGLAGAPASG
jgi:hypothetical protein